MPPDLDELKKKANELRRTLNKIDQITGHSRDRTADVGRKRAQREDERTILIPEPEDMERRLRLEADDIAWLMYYFGKDSGVADPFTYEFTEQQVEMVRDITRVIEHGGDKATAASRGEGKTTICERLIIKNVLQGRLKFVLLCCATATLAEASLDSIRSAIEDNNLLAADYPEVCVPVSALEGVAQRAKTLLASGKRPDNGAEYHKERLNYSWCGKELILPGVPGSASRHAIIATRGLDSAVRGIKRKGRRVDLVVIDDPDTQDTARSEEQAKLLMSRIDKDLGGLGGQTRSVARVMLTTLQSRTSASYHYTDQKKSRRGWVVATAFWFGRLTARTFGRNTSGDD